MLTQTDKQAVYDGIKEGWDAFRVLQGSPTVDVLRYTVTGDSDVKVVEGTKSQVSGLSSIKAAVFPRVRKRKMVRGLIQYEEADMVFVIYDTEVVLTDLIQYGDKKYQVIQSNYNAGSGRCVIRASKV